MTQISNLSAEARDQLDLLRAAFVEVTGELADINPTDRVYRSASGRMIKVRELAADPAFGIRVWTYSASDCDAAGKALPLGAGHRITPPHTLTRQVQPGVLVADDMTERRELERLKVAAMALQAGDLMDGEGA